jgi:outer membrane protein OmpA-like peptidoglycan-associated protein
MNDVGQTATHVRHLVADVQAGRGTVGQLMRDDSLYRRLTDTADEVRQATANLRATTDAARSAVEDFRSPDGAGQQLVRGLKDTIDETQEVMSDLAEGTEALKRNVLFRGFFRDRGFYDMDALSRDAYKRGALEGRNRTALRVWLSTASLFAMGEDGVERLTADGRERLESAMLDLGRFPQDSALVVEGHATAGDGTGPELLRASTRAEAVRDYLLTRFNRRPNLTGTMPLDEAVESPTGDGRWSGVALALFVRTDRLPQ